MNRVLALALALSCALPAVAFAGTIVVPLPEKEATVLRKGEVARITASGIAGSTIDIKVVGKAKVARNGVVHRAGSSNTVGTTAKEVEISPDGKGRIKVTVSVKGPTDTEAKVTVYELDAQ